MKLTDRLSASSDVVSREVGSETILLDLASGAYFGLDPVGARIWALIEEKAAITVGEICDAVILEFEVKRDVLERDVSALAENLAARQLVSVVRT